LKKTKAPSKPAHSKGDGVRQQDLPIIVEIVDTRDKLEKFLALIDNEIKEGMATLEEVRIHFYRSGQKPDRA
jgi:PII-like signaling protein